MHSSACMGACPRVFTTSCWREAFPQASFKWKLPITSIFLPDKRLMVFPGGGRADRLQGRRGHRTSWEKSQPGSHTSLPGVGSSFQGSEGAQGKQPREAWHSASRPCTSPLVPAHHLQTGGKCCRKEQDPNRAPVAAMGAGGVGLRRAREGTLEQRCYKLWAQQTRAVSWVNCCMVVLNKLFGKPV